MTQRSANAAAILWQNWQQRTRIDELPLDCRPLDRAAGYSAQQAIVRFSGQDVVGWKIAATSAAGQ
ncbi:MAG: hydratase, partial [Acidobacteria bacterium]